MFLNGLYCWFITFTTVGFGDFIPGDGLEDVPKKIALSLYLVGSVCHVKLTEHRLRVGFPRDLQNSVC